MVYIYSAQMKELGCQLHWRTSWVTCLLVFTFTIGLLYLTFVSYLFPFATPFLAVKKCMACSLNLNSLRPRPTRNSSWCDWLVSYLSQGGLENSHLWTQASVFLTKPTISSFFHPVKKRKFSFVSYSGTQPFCGTLSSQGDGLFQPLGFCITERLKLQR